MAGLAVHVVIILFMTFSSAPDNMRRSMVARGYQYFVHIGPFFREDAIQASQHVVAGYLKNGSWIHIDMTDSLFQRYLRAPWKVDQLSIRDAIRENARNLVGRKGWRKSGDLIQLQRHATHNYPWIENSDSLKIILITRWYKPELKRHIADTLFHQTFSPSDE